MPRGQWHDKKVQKSYIGGPAVQSGVLDGAVTGQSNWGVRENSGKKCKDYKYYMKTFNEGSPDVGVVLPSIR